MIFARWFSGEYDALILRAGYYGRLMMMEKELVFQDEVRKTEGVRSDFTGWSVRAGFVSVKARLCERKSY
jgi:hypothetical protein